jgi:uncharacterized protein YjbI with pentapeptide repeats
MTKHWTVLGTASLATLLALFAPAPVARADIFQWEYINPADPSLGKQPSTTLAPDGAGANAVPGTNLSNRDLTKAYLIGADLSLSFFCFEETCFINYADLTGTTLAQADLTNASLYGAILTDADLTGAEVRGVNFTRNNHGDTGGITAVQLYSTASYQAHDLSGIGLSGYNLAGINLSVQNLTGAVLSNASLSNADFSGANLTDVDLKGSGLTVAQLYSTASYQDNDLKGINLDGSNLSGANLANQNLSRASFYGATLTNADFQLANLSNASFTFPLASFPLGTHVATNLIGANLSLANLTNARFGGGEECQGEFCWFFEGANLSNANLSGADARNAYFLYASMIGTNTENMIQPNGHIAGLDLTFGASLIVRDYDGNAAIAPIVVEQHLAMDATGTLRLAFDADPWDSTISFAPGIPVVLGGTLDLTFAPDVSIATQIGRTIDLFDWTGVTPSGAFTVESPYTWNLSQLYTTGEVTLAAAPNLPGDYNNNGVVDSADYTVWRDRLGQSVTLANEHPAAATPGLVDAEDYAFWTANFGNVLPELGAGAAAHLAPGESPGANYAVPEPASLALAAGGGLGLLVGARRRPRGSHC